MIFIVLSVVFFALGTALLYWSIEVELRKDFHEAFTKLAESGFLGSAYEEYKKKSSGPMGVQ